MECQPIGEVLIRQESGIPCLKEKLFGKGVEVCGLLGCGRVVSFFDFPYFPFHYPEIWGSKPCQSSICFQIETMKMSHNGS